MAEAPLRHFSTHVVRSLPFHLLTAMARNRGAKCFYLTTLSDAPFLGGDLRWPNGPWPGEKTLYFSAKTGHMARHGIWPSDRLCLRWAGWVKPCHGLVRWRAGCVRWPRRVTSWRAWGRAK